jgi:hypothetical protein
MGVLVGYSNRIGHIRKYGMKLIVIGVMKTKQIAQSLWVLLDCVMIVVTIGRKVFAPDERTLSLNDDL